MTERLDRRGWRRAPRQRQRGDPGDRIDPDGDELRAPDSQRGDEHEVGEQRPERGPQRVRGVEVADEARRPFEARRDDEADEQGQRPPHQERGGGDEGDCDQVAEGVGARGEDVPAARVVDVPRGRGGHRAEPREHEREAETEERDGELGEGIHPEGPAIQGIFPERPVARAAEPVRAGAEARHEDTGDERRGVNGVAEDVAELPDPDDLVDEAAHPREEEDHQHGCRASTVRVVGHSLETLSHGQSPSRDPAPLLTRTRGHPSRGLRSHAFSPHGQWKACGLVRIHKVGTGAGARRTAPPRR